MGLSDVIESSRGRMHSSRMFRSDSIPQSGFIYDVNMTNLDFVWIIQLLINSQKKVGYLDEILGKYRVIVGVSSKQNYRYSGLAGSLKSISLVEESGLVGIEQLNKAKSRVYCVFAQLSLKDKDYANFVNGIVKSRSYFHSMKNSILYRMRYFPWLASFLYRKYKAFQVNK
jgi:hypothetical protein